MVNMTNDPVSTMWSAAGSVVVRVGSFFVAAWLSMVVAACVVNGPPVVVIQALETTRFLLHNEESWPTRALVLLAILGALLSAMAILYVRRTSWLGRPHA
jgi:H+/Cl- antiporter ClcA